MKTETKLEHYNRQSSIVNRQLKRVLIAGTHSGVGKTTVTLGIMSILSRRGFNVQAFKSGPDYIDTSHHSAITGNKSRNLDTWMMEDNDCSELFYRSAIKADISIIEGVMGLYDGRLGDNGKGSSAYLAKVLNTPVILVIDVKGMAQSAGAVALGFKGFDKHLKLEGIILNRVGSQKQFETIRVIIEGKINIPVLGYLSRNNDISIPERHLGLVPSNEDQGINKVYCEIGERLEKTLQVDKILEIADCAGDFPEFKNNIFPITDSVLPNSNLGSAHDLAQSSIVNRQSSIKLAVAMDKAFHFYYQDNLELLEALGARLCYFSPLDDKKLPDGIDGIYIGGGFPELFGDILEANESMRYAIKEASRNGIVIYAECGGMMYLLDKLVDCNRKSYIMCGVFDAISKMQNKRQGLGYVDVCSYADNILCKKEGRFKAHEFHWSSLVEIENNKKLTFAYKISKGENSNTKFDGLFNENVLASYAHVHFATNPLLAINLLRSMGLIKRGVNKSEKKL